MEEKNPLTNLDNNKIPPYLLESKYFDELGYKEFDQLCNKFLGLFSNKKFKAYDKEKLVKLAILISNRCSNEAEAEHEVKYQTSYYKLMEQVSKYGLSLLKNDEELLWNLGIASYSLEKYEQALDQFRKLLKIQIKGRGKEKMDDEIRSTPLSYLRSIYKALGKKPKNKKVLRKIELILKKYKQS